jgi:hypothetical protein
MVIGKNDFRRSTAGACFVEFCDIRGANTRGYPEIQRRDLASHVVQHPMGFIWLAWKKRREGGFPDFERGSWAAKYEP